MGWEQQGRQYHAWFGSGTSDPTARAARPPTQAEAVAQVLQDTAAALPPRRQAAFEAYLASGGGVSLARAIPVWASAATLGPEQFRTLLARPRMSEAAAASLQEAGRSFAAVPGQAGIEAATRHLAHAIGSDASVNWKYNFAGAVSQTVYADASGLLPEENFADLSNRAKGGPGMPDPAVHLVAGLKCEGGPGACQNGGSYGAGAMYIIGGRKLCFDCASRKTGTSSSPAAERVEILKPFLIK